MDQIYKLSKKKLKEIESTTFNLEKDIQTIVENNTEELFEIKLIKSEFSVGGYRIDSLCFDEESNSTTKTTSSLWNRVFKRLILRD